MTERRADTPARPAGSIGRCPICGKPARLETRPFCSARCRDVDLARWLGGVYRVPGEPLGEVGDLTAGDPDAASGDLPLPKPANER